MLYNYNRMLGRDFVKKLSYLPLEIELKRQRMSKTELQKLTKLSTTTIAKINKNQDISMKALRIIAEVLNCDIGELLTFNDVYKKGSK